MCLSSIIAAYLLYLGIASALG